MSKFQPRSIAIPGMFELKPTDAKGNGLSMRLAVRCTSHHIGNLALVVNQCMPIRLTQVDFSWKICRVSDFPKTLLEFQQFFPDETACLRHMESIRWPDGFKCSACNHIGEPWRLQSRLRVVECSECGHQTSLTAGTVMQGSRLPLHTWFWAAYLVTMPIRLAQVDRELNGLKPRYRTDFVAPSHSVPGQPVLTG